ncbi:MAG: hypothetical protein FWG49_03245 [Leptospirales bacterium]|nr:hypothetical protein [Leptospirales bacterium]
MKAKQTAQKTVLGMTQKIRVKDAEESKYSILSKEDALTMTTEIIEKYRPALKKLAE